MPRPSWDPESCQMVSHSMLSQEITLTAWHPLNISAASCVICLQAAAAKEYADPGTPNPRVAWVSHFAYDGAEEYQISWAPYKAELAEGAGADMLSQEEIAAIPGGWGTPCLFVV